jgi:hypothetical protein
MAIRLKKADENSGKWILRNQAIFKPNTSGSLYLTIFGVRCGAVC